MALHPQPQVIAPVLNPGGSRPPHGLTRASTCSGLDHPASGPGRATQRLLRLAFATRTPHGLRSPHATDSQTHFSIGTPSPHKEGSDGSQAHGFRDCFTPLPGYFSPFPHGTCALSVRQEYLGLCNGLHGFARDSTGPVLLGRRDRETMRVRLRGHHPLRPGIQPGSPRTRFYHSRPARRSRDTRSLNTTRATPDGYHTHAVWPDPLSLATTHGISFPAGTEMFHFPAYPPAEAGDRP